MTMERQVWMRQAWMRQAWARLVAFFWKHEPDRDLESELGAFLDLATRDHLQRGRNVEEGHRPRFSRESNYVGRS